MRHLTSFFLILCAWLSLITPVQATASQDWRFGAMAGAGSMTLDNWETVLGLEGQITWSEPRLLAFGAYAEQALGNPRFLYGAEALLLAHLDGDPHLELSVPLTVRYRALDPWVPLQGAGAGLGLSYATAVPELEVERKGESTQLLLTWFVELELGRPEWPVSPFLRLHHRSDGFGVVDVDTGSNGVLLGLRVPF